VYLSIYLPCGGIEKRIPQLFFFACGNKWFEAFLCPSIVF